MGAKDATAWGIGAGVLGLAAVGAKAASLAADPGFATHSEVLFELLCFVLAHVIGTFGVVIPVILLSLWCFAGLRVVPEHVLQLCAVFVFWNLHLVGYASFMLPIMVSAHVNDLRYTHVCQQCLIIWCLGPSPVILGVGVGKAVSYKMGWMPWATPHKLFVVTLAAGGGFLGMSLQHAIEPAGLPIVGTIIVTYWAYCLQTHIGDPETTGSRQWQDFVKLVPSQRLIQLVGEFLEFSVVWDDQTAVAAAMLRPDCGAIVGFHPHGVIPYTAALLTTSPDWGRPPHYMVDAFIHVMPLIRDVVEWMGCLEVSKQGVHRVLDSKAAAMLVVGGQAEMLDSKSWDGELIIHSTHRGFVRIALEHAAPLVPVLSLNEPQLMDNVHWPRIMAWARKNLGFPIPFIPYGSFICTPRRHGRTTVIVGCPIHPPVLAEPGKPTAAEVEATHEQYFEALSNMFVRYNAKYGDANVKLVIIDAHSPRK